MNKNKGMDHLRQSADVRKTDMNKYLMTIMKSAPNTARLGAKNFRQNRLKHMSNVPNSEVKPAILESRISMNEDFFNLSDGFKRIFSNDRKDKKMILPISGYGGHRRGDRSQNFFGKSFRESSLQSKKLERSLRCSTAA